MQRKKPCDLDRVFGTGTVGCTPEERARVSTKRWIRDLDYLRVYTGRGDGLIMTALEVLEIFGLELLVKIEEEGSVCLTSDPREPGRSIRAVRVARQMSERDLASAAAVSVNDVFAIEGPSHSVPMSRMERVCRVLDLDPRRITFVSYA